MIMPDPSDGKVHVAVCIPTHESLPYQFAASLSNMIGYTIHAIGDRVNISTHWVAGTYIHRAREQLLEEILELGAHYVLWLDSDHSFPRESLIHLLAHDVPMVGINYSTRGMPNRYVAIKRTMAEHIDDKDNPPALLRTGPEHEGLQEVEALGFGMVLMKLVVTQGMDPKEPFFWFGQMEETGSHVGEDVWFCRKVRENGYKIYVDADLSKACTHVGQLEYKLDHIWAIEEEGYESVDYNVQLVKDRDSELAGSERSDGEDSDDDPVGGSEDEEGPEA